MRFPAIAAVAALPLAIAAMPAAAQSAGTVTLYELPGYLGRSVTVSAATPDLATLSFSARARSARVSGGSWLICPQKAYAGSCKTLSANTPLLSRSAAVSARPASDTSSTTTPTATTPAAGTNTKVDLSTLDVDAGVEGQDVAFFARPSLGGTQVSAGSNDRTAGDAFCKLAGFTASANAGRARTQTSSLLDLSNGTRVRAYALRDVLCRR